MGYELTGAASLIQEFAAERDWDQFHTVKNLSMALAGEVGELVEIFQWLDDDAVRELLGDIESRRQIEAEVADIAIYLLRIAQVAEIDLDRAIREKLAVNAKRYPVELSRGNAIKYSRRGIE